MARPLRIEFPGAVYHVTARGNRQGAIFHDDVDRRALRDIFGGALERFDASALAWCLMGNHYHWVIQTRQANLSLLMRHVNGVYTQRFNRRHQKVGHVFQGRFKAILVDSQHYLLEACRYVELNPVRAGLAQDLAQWPWSSYAALTGLAPCPPWLDRMAVWGHVLGKDVGSQPKLSGQAAHRHAHLSLSEIARGLGLSVSRVSRIVSKQAKGKT